MKRRGLIQRTAQGANASTDTAASASPARAKASAKSSPGSRLATTVRSPPYSSRMTCARPSNRTPKLPHLRSRRQEERPCVRFLPPRPQRGERAFPCFFRNPPEQRTAIQRRPCRRKLFHMSPSFVGKTTDFSSAVYYTGGMESKQTLSNQRRERHETNDHSH